MLYFRIERQLIGIHFFQIYREHPTFLHPHCPIQQRKNNEFVTKPEPLISIIIPTFNRSNLLKETLDSVITQTYKNWECLLIDDGSNDDTETVAANYILKDARIKFYKRPETYKSGGNGARNYGLDLAKGEFINWFDNDDVMLPGFLQDKIDKIKCQHHFVISSHQIVDKNLNVIKTINLKINDYIFKDYVLGRENFCIGTPNVLFRKDLLIQNNYRFNEEIKRGQEAELFSRIFFKTRKEDFELIQKTGYQYRQHDDSKTKKSAYFNIEFKVNHTDINLRDLDYSLQLNDNEISKHIIGQILYNLFLARNHSKETYWYILNGINQKLYKEKYWSYYFHVLKVYYYLPRSIDSFEALVRKKIFSYVS